MGKLFRYIGGVLFWSLISAAFIGPGTVITALTAGRDHGLQLLWTLIFAVIACIVLQEATARLKILTNLNLGQAIARKYKEKQWLPILVVSGIIFGCVAYQAGNLTGAALGILPKAGIRFAFLLVIILVLAGLMLRTGRVNVIGRGLGVIVALMGTGFIVLSTGSSFSTSEILRSAIQPGFPNDSYLLAIGLIGTTIVPYNLFLGSGIAPAQSLRSMRAGLITAIIIGGIISMAILISGTLIRGGDQVYDLGPEFAKIMGTHAEWLFIAGLFSAGFTSSVTAPLAAAVTAGSIIRNPQGWSTGSWRFRRIWMGVLFAGGAFALLGGSPVIIIILAQAINGFLLPGLVYLILMVLNDKNILKQGNSWLNNGLLVIILGVTTLIGSLNLVKTIDSTFGLNLTQKDGTLYLLIGLSVLLALLTGYKLFKIRTFKPGDQDS